MKLADMPAFPRTTEIVSRNIGGGADKEQGHPGMTLRQYYAGLAMQNMKGSPIAVAKAAVGYADALLAELEK